MRGHLMARILRAAMMALACSVLRAAGPADPPIRITINAEARVSVAIVGVLPTTARCGVATEVPVRVVNHGFVTARLEARLVGDIPAGASVVLEPSPLKGLPDETRILRISLERPGAADLTVAFSARNEVADLGGRDRIHFVIRGRQAP